jgi:hypothetical protein
MPHSSVSALLIEAPVGRHFAQLHRKRDELVKAVGQFIETGLQRQQGVVVIATNTHTALILDYLTRQEIDSESCRRSGQLVLRDAEATLETFMRGDMPDWAEFRRHVGSLIESVQSSGLSAIRAYGEMVNVLWKQGKAGSAIKLEEYWNSLAQIYPFSLFCGYMLDHHDEGSYHDPLHEIGRTHDHIISTDDDERFRVALDAASRDIFGTALTELIGMSAMEDFPGEQRLPPGQRTMLWIMRHVPASSGEVLQLARMYYQNPP